MESRPLLYIFLNVVKLLYCPHNMILAGCPPTDYTRYCRDGYRTRGGCPNAYSCGKWYTLIYQSYQYIIACMNCIF